MLSKYQLDFYKLTGWFYFYLYEVPVRFDEKTLKVHLLPRRKWYPWLVGISFVFILWLNCIYILGTEPYFPRRNNYGSLNACLFMTGFLAFGAVLLIAYGFMDSNAPSKIAAVNGYLQLELLLINKYDPCLLKHKFGALDLVFLLMVFGNFLPHMLVLACLYWDVDGPYFVIEDWAPDPKYRELSTILIFLGIRTFFILPGFIETTRVVVAYAPLALYMIDSVTRTIRIFCYHVTSAHDFFKHYTRLRIISNILENAIMRLFVIGISICFLMLVQTGWVLVRGLKRLNPMFYAMFVILWLILNATTLVFLPQVTMMGNMINGLPQSKKAEMKRKYLEKPTFFNKVAVKMANAIQPVTFSYGRFYPMEANFCRNVFGNMMENLMNAVLVFEFN